MNTLTITVGFPASGKSTWAAKQQAENPNTVVVCMDDIRAMLHGARPYSGVDESLTVAVRDHTISVAAKLGWDVIVADTNPVTGTRNRLRRMAGRLGMEFRINDLFLDVPFDVCVARDAGREYPVGRAVFDRMAESFDEASYTAV